MSYEIFALLLITGGFVGITAGLLGIGGGLIIVPTLNMVLPQVGIAPESVMSISLATSLSTIILTSGSSALNHLKLGHVDIFIIKSLLPGVMIGGVVGSYIVEWIPFTYLPKIFACIVLLLALQMLVSIKSVKKQRKTPSMLITALSGGAIGTVSSLSGIGGGSLIVPLLTQYGIEMRKAVGSSSVCSVIIAASGMMGFIFHGTGVEGLPKYSIGYVYVPALAAIVITSVLTTKIGVNLATKLPTELLKKIFAVFLLFVAGKMLLSV